MIKEYTEKFFPYKAIQYDSKNIDEIKEFTKNKYGFYESTKQPGHYYGKGPGDQIIDLENGDYVLEWSKSLIEIVKKDDFEKYYKEYSDETEILNCRLNYIRLLGHDYDGYNTVDSLKKLIDEFISVIDGEQDEVVKEVYDI